jgi:hypothetical protein
MKKVRRRKRNSKRKSDAKKYENTSGLRSLKITIKEI